MMETERSAGHGAQPAAPRRHLHIWLSVAAALLAIAASAIGLTQPAIYAGLTPAFYPQALAQDAANLAIASPAILILAALALRGSLRAYLLWLGVVTFAVYNYVIYTFSIPFGPLFLPWVAVLGLSLFALIGGVAGADHAAIQARFGAGRPIRPAAWFLLAVGAFFGFLWLSEDIPALMAGRMPQSVMDMALPTNPVHILDLAFFLPAVMATGVMLLRRRPLGYVVAPAMLVFLLLTGIPILMTPVVQSVRGAEASWAVFGPIGVLSILVLGMLVWLLSAVRRLA